MVEPGEGVCLDQHGDSVELVLCPGSLPSTGGPRGIRMGLVMGHAVLSILLIEPD